MAGSSTTRYSDCSEILSFRGRLVVWNWVS